MYQFYKWQARIEFEFQVSNTNSYLVEFITDTVLILSLNRQYVDSKH